MDLAGTAMASKIAGGRIATVAIDRMAFMVPVAVGAQLSFYTQTLEVGRSSIRMLVEVWSDDPLSSEWRKVTEAVFVFVAIDGSGRTARSRHAGARRRNAGYRRRSCLRVPQARTGLPRTGASPAT